MGGRRDQTSGQHRIRKRKKVFAPKKKSKGVSLVGKGVDGIC